MHSPAIVFVLPFARLAETALAVADEWGVAVQALVGDLDKGVERALAAQAAGAEVIISRGGTASMIAGAVSIPVVEVRVTSSDVLRSFSQAAPARGKIGLAGFRNIIYGCEAIGGVLGLEMVQVAIPDQAGARQAIAQARASGVVHVIGDHISYQCARELGLPATLIESGREGMAQALLEAQHVLKVRREIARQKLYRKGLVAKSSLEQITGHSPAIARVKTEAERYARTDATVLILGESGTGKELAAQGIHRASGRHQGPFVAVNCASVPEALLQSELFGYAEGAFTGARRGGRQGLFELAHGGTIFLDEIGELPLSLQGHLLRVLQEKEVMRIGGDSVTPVNVRVVAATNRSLEAEVAAGRLRADLFYRLNILRLEMPPLRTRLEDLPELAGALLEGLRQKYGEPRALTDGALEALMGYSWPGNVRELENLLERLWVVTDGPLIDRSMVEAHLPAAASLEGQGQTRGLVPWAGLLNLAEIESLAIDHALAATGGNLEQAAERLGIHRSTLFRKLQRNKQNATTNDA